MPDGIRMKDFNSTCHLNFRQIFLPEKTLTVQMGSKDLSPARIQDHWASHAAPSPHSRPQEILSLSTTHQLSEHMFSSLPTNFLKDVSTCAVRSLQTPHGPWLHFPAFPRNRLPSGSCFWNKSLLKMWMLVDRSVCWLYLPAAPTTV